MQIILDLLMADGIQPAHIGKNEWHSPCPFCGTGVDRFSSWPERRNSNGAYHGGRFVCRRCGQSGDAIAYLMKRRNLSFRDACSQLQIEPGRMPERMNRVKPEWIPAPPKPNPGQVWADRAKAFLLSCKQNLQQNPGVMEWLMAERGLERETIERFQLGWNPVDRYDSRADWGLPDERNQNGKLKRLWLPMGLVIPWRDESGQVVRIRIRRAEPGQGSRYIITPGSSMQPMTLWNQQQATCILESELDALLVYQQAGDVIGVVSMGSAVMKPDDVLHDRLMKAETVLNCFDTDKAGQESAWTFWNRYPGFRRWPPLMGKDPGDMHKAGLPLRAWIQAAVDYIAILPLFTELR